MNKPQIGLVIPIVQRKYIISLIKQINKTAPDNKIAICVVNDGNNKIENYLDKYLPKEIELLNLENNLCFAGANNAGWELLINKYPSIKYLGSINDDTDPQDQWLKYLVQSMETDSNIGACGPVMITYANKFIKRKIKYTSTWKLGTEKAPMIIDKKRITSDTYVSVLGGFCFLAKAEALLQIDYFDVRYQNSCEDIDLCLKLRLN